MLPGMSLKEMVELLRTDTPLDLYEVFRDVECSCGHHGAGLLYGRWHPRLKVMNHIIRYSGRMDVTCMRCGAPGQMDYDAKSETANPSVAVALYQVIPTPHAMQKYGTWHRNENTMLIE